MVMGKRLILVPVMVLVVALLGCSEQQSGEVLFNENCSNCHGVQGVGTSMGPPLVHKIYEPGHHGDSAFRNAVRNGVVSHHWDFGDMSPVVGLSDDEVELIIGYVRELQREKGIIE